MPNDEGRLPSEMAIPIRFRIVHLLYATALIGSALATFGIGGVLLAVMLCTAWGWVFVSESRPRALPTGFLVLLLSGCLYGLLAPAFSAARQRALRMQCPNNLKQIALAFHNYHDIYKSFPPAYIADENGRPMHSWRVLILPLVEEQPRYEAYRFDEPWDGPNNRKLQSPMPAIYVCPSHKSISSHAQTHTSYVAIAGENTAWPGARATRIRDIIDGTAQTLLVCEVADSQISWMEPTDTGYAEAIELLTSRDPHQRSGHMHRSFFYKWSTGRQVALADGSVKFLVQGIEADDTRRLLTVNDGELLEFDAIRGNPSFTRRLRIDNCIRLGVFVLLALWPLPWVWINPHGSRALIQLDEAVAAD